MKTSYLGLSIMVPITILLASGCDQTSGTPGTGNPQGEPAAAVAAEPMTTFSPEDFALSGLGESPSVQSFPVQLETGVEYHVSFSAAVGEGEEVELIVDLYPDELPQTQFAVTQDMQDFEWTFSSDEAAMSNSELRFFGFFPVGTEIEVTDVKLERVSGS